VGAEENPRDAAIFQSTADFPQTFMPFYRAAERHTDRQPKFRRANVVSNGLSEGWLYLATVINLYSRKVVGWSMNSRMQTSLALNALLMAV